MEVGASQLHLKATLVFAVFLRRVTLRVEALPPGEYIFVQIHSLPAGGTFRAGEIEFSPIKAVHKAELCSQTLLYQALHAEDEKKMTSDIF